MLPINSHIQEYETVSDLVENTFLHYAICHSEHLVCLNRNVALAGQRGKHTFHVYACIHSVLHNYFLALKNLLYILIVSGDCSGINKRVKRIALLCLIWNSTFPICFHPLGGLGSGQINYSRAKENISPLPQSLEHCWSRPSMRSNGLSFLVGIVLYRASPMRLVEPDIWGAN